MTTESVHVCLRFECVQVGVFKLCGENAQETVSVAVFLVTRDVGAHSDTTMVMQCFGPSTTWLATSQGQANFIVLTNQILSTSPPYTGVVKIVRQN